MIGGKVFEIAEAVDCAVSLVAFEGNGAGAVQSLDKVKRNAANGKGRHGWHLLQPSNGARPNSPSFLSDWVAVTAALICAIVSTGSSGSISRVNLSALTSM